MRPRKKRAQKRPGRLAEKARVSTAIRKQSKKHGVEKEIIIGLVGGIGVDFENVICCFKRELKKQGYVFEDIVLSDFVKAAYPLREKDQKSELGRIRYLMNKGTALRKKYCKPILSLLAVAKIFQLRKQHAGNGDLKIAYFVKSFKRPEEVKLMRRIYGRNFILVSVHSSDEFREKNIFQKEISKNKKQNRNEIKKELKELVKKDFEETLIVDKRFGQNLSCTFPNAHIFLNTDGKLSQSIERFIDILFNHPFHTPTIDERNMFIAKGIALRSSDLSRQVGAVICNQSGDVIATGCNDVPKFGGGLYEPNDKNDGRDFKKGKDTNVQEKKEILEDILEKLKIIYPRLRTAKLSGKDIYEKLDQVNAKITDLLEFGRPVHAEMEAICDAARRGISVKGTTLYCTTYPCHLCAKLILAVGIRRVVYIDPYPKSAAKKLFEEVIKESQGDVDADDNFLIIDAFMGVSPRRYLHVFKQENRKKKDKLYAKEPERDSDSRFLSVRSPLNYILREIALINEINVRYKLPLAIKSSLKLALDKSKKEYTAIDSAFSIKNWGNANWEELIGKKGK